MSDSVVSKGIPFAFYHKHWSFEEGVITDLEAEAKRVTADEYEPLMDGKLFCPKCFTNLIRIPKGGAKSLRDGRKAFFSHLERYNDNECDFRIPKSDELRPAKAESAPQPAEGDKVVIIKKFHEISHDTSNSLSGYHGKVSLKNLSEAESVTNKGFQNEKTSQASEFNTVEGICRAFDKNLSTPFQLPHMKHAVKLAELLVDIKTVNTVSITPALYFGKISSTNFSGKTPRHLRMTRFEHPEEGECKDFYLKASNESQTKHGISDDSVGRVVIIYGIVSLNGIGLCIEKPKHAEFALLPEKYNHLLGY